MGRRLSEENRKVVSGKGSSLHTGRLFLIRACLDWSHPHCTSTSTPCSQLGASCCSQQDGGAALTERGQELTPGLAIPPAKGLGRLSGFQGAAPKVSLISSQQSEGPVPPGCPAWPCHLSPPQPVGSRGTWVSCSKALSSLPSLCSRCRSSQRSCRHKASLFPRASPCLPSSLVEQGCDAGECRRLLDQGKGSTRMDLAGMGLGAPRWPRLFFSSKGCLAKAQTPVNATPHRNHRQGEPGSRMLLLPAALGMPSFPSATGRTA